MSRSGYATLPDICRSCEDSPASVEFSLIKRTDLGIREGMNLEFRIDAINLFNRIGICDPATDVNDDFRFR